MGKVVGDECIRTHPAFIKKTEILLKILNIGSMVQKEPEGRILVWYF